MQLGTSIGLAITLSSNFSGAAAAAVSTWILATGFWVDSGDWQDAETWND